METIIEELGKITRQPKSPAAALLSNVVVSLGQLNRINGFHVLSGVLETVGMDNEEKNSILNRFDELRAAVKADLHGVGRYLFAKSELC